MILPTHLLNKFQRFLKKKKQEIEALKNIIENKYLVKQKPEKRNTIVILNKNDYPFETYTNSR